VGQHQRHRVAKRKEETLTRTREQQSYAEKALFCEDSAASLFNC
jgi:hypothetical protein